MLDFQKLKEQEPLYIIGHKKPDVDSVVATIILTNILQSKNIICYPCFLDKDYEIDNYNCEMIDDCISLDMKIINLDDSYNYVLVDHNDPTQSVGFNKKIVWGIDHHSNSRILNNIELDNTCSCSLLIYKYFKNNYVFSEKEKFMIYMASLADSLFFKGSRYSDEDALLIKELGFKLDSQDMFNKYFKTTDLTKGIDNVIDNPSKIYNYRGIEFNSVVVKVNNEKDYLRKEFIEKIKKQDNYLCVWINFDQEVSFAYFYCFGKLKEIKYDFIASRAASVIPDIYKYIDEEIRK